jgi:hypothetical protein
MKFMIALSLNCPYPSAHSSAIANGGYEISSSHCNKQAIKTNAPPEFMWDVMRAWVRRPRAAGRVKKRWIWTGSFSDFFIPFPKGKKEPHQQKGAGKAVARQRHSGQGHDVRGRGMTGVRHDSHALLSVDVRPNAPPVRHEIDFSKNDKATFDSKRQGLRRFQVNEPFWGPQSKAKPTLTKAGTKR